MVGSVKAKKIRYTKTKKREFLIQQRARLTASPEENIRARGAKPLERMWEERKETLEKWTDFFLLFLSKPEEEVSNRGRSECSRRLKDYMELKSFIPSSQFRNRLCRDCNYCFRVLSPASRPCVGGVKLGDFSFVGNQTITQLAFWFYISNWGVPVW